MKNKIWAQCVCFVGLALTLAGCSTHADPTAEAPPPAHVEHEQDLNIVKVDHPEHFSLVTAGQRAARSQLVVTGTVNPDISRTVPVISIAAGRVVETHARLGDTVQKGQLLMRVQSSDISGAFSDYRKAVADEALARTQLGRAKDLIGGLVALLVTGTHFSVSSGVGLLALFGVSVQTGVIMLEYINRLRSRGHSIVESAVEGAVLRLRPIMMTMLVATLGLLPAAMSHAIGSDSQRPFAIVIVGGLMVNLAMSIFILPTLYVWFAREGDKLPEPEESFDAKPGAV